MDAESGLPRAVVFAVSVPVMLYETGSRVAVVLADDLAPGSASVCNHGLVRIARADCSALSSLLPVLRLAGGLYRWHGLSDATRRTLQREAERVRSDGDVRAAFHQATDAEIIVGQALRGDAPNAVDEVRSIIKEIGFPEVRRWGWFFGPPCFLFLLPWAFLMTGFQILQNDFRNHF